MLGAGCLGKRAFSDAAVSCSCQCSAQLSCFTPRPHQCRFPCSSCKGNGCSHHNRVLCVGCRGCLRSCQCRGLGVGCKGNGCSRHNRVSCVGCKGCLRSCQCRGLGVGMRGQWVQSSQQGVGYWLWMACQAHATQPGSRRSALCASLSQTPSTHIDPPRLHCSWLSSARLHAWRLPQRAAGWATVDTAPNQACKEGTTKRQWQCSVATAVRHELENALAAWCPAHAATSQRAWWLLAAPHASPPLHESVWTVV